MFSFRKLKNNTNAECHDRTRQTLLVAILELIWGRVRESAGPLWMCWPPTRAKQIFDVSAGYPSSQAKLDRNVCRDSPRRKRPEWVMVNESWKKLAFRLKMRVVSKIVVNYIAVKISGKKMNVWNIFSTWIRSISPWKKIEQYCSTWNAVKINPNHSE